MMTLEEAIKHCEQKAYDDIDILPRMNSRDS